MDRVLIELERALRAGPGALAFDADGTLWSGDVGEDVFLQATQGRLLRPEAAPALTQMAAEFGVEQRSETNEQATTLYEAYRRGTLPETAACEMMAWAFAGWEEAELFELAETLLSRAELSARRFLPVHRAVDWARDQGLAAVVISASPDFVVRAATHTLGFTALTIAACQPRVVERILTTKLAAPLPYGEHKLTALARLLPGESLLGAFGDNSFDLPLLRAARVAVAVRPKPALRDLLPSLPRAITVLE
jgi:phosphoserine phosphatase